MTQEEIIRRNKVIAKFMGLCIPNKLNSDEFGLVDWQYNSSWDWLMPVVEKIEGLGYWTEICHSHLGTTKRPGKLIWCGITKENHTNVLQDDCFIEITRVESESKIEAVFIAVSDFCEWYENQAK